MQKITVCGHFGGDSLKLDGQTIKTKIIVSELIKSYGEKSIYRIDTCGRINQLLFLFRLVYAVLISSCVIIFPAQNALKVEAPLLALLIRFFRCKIHYVVIGGWLPDYLSQHRWVKRALYMFDGIYVELDSMRQKLMEMHYRRVYVMPNFRENSILLLKNEGEKSIEAPYRFVHFSRVTREKGIEDAVEVVKQLNAEKGENYCILDIYGEVNPDQKNWFDNLMSSVPYNITYRGTIPYQRSVEVLTSYHVMLFPTYYEGEGMAGSIIDAYAAGLPVVVSDWKYNAEIVKDGETGFLFETHCVEDFYNKICLLCSSPDLWRTMRSNCRKEYLGKYTPKSAMKVLLDNIIF